MIYRVIKQHSNCIVYPALDVDLGLNGKVAVVAGGNRGIGRAVALEPAREVIEVAIVARGEAVGEQAAEAITEATGSRVIVSLAARNLVGYLPTSEIPPASQRFSLHHAHAA